jgi:hypothetical protein
MKMADIVQTIEIDCVPATPRPDSYIEGIIEGTGLELKEPSDKSFGMWTWDYSEVPNEKWKEIQPILKERITKLYRNGNIRYGSW